MANTCSQIYIQVVFAVEGRQNLMQKQHKEELHKYITGIVTEREQKLLAVHCMPDHTHVLIGLKPSIALSDLVRDVKNARLRDKVRDKVDDKVKRANVLYAPFGYSADRPGTGNQMG